MKIDPKMVDALNQQIFEEMNSYYIYLGFSAELESMGRSGMSVWMMMQAQEEMEHAMKLYKYVQERGAKVELKAIPAPNASCGKERDAFEAGYKHELHITSCIYKLSDLAKSLNDKATEIFLDWYVKEQVEEEDNAETILQKFDQVGGSPNGLYMLDKELGKRARA